MDGQPDAVVVRSLRQEDAPRLRGFPEGRGAR